MKKTSIRQKTKSSGGGFALVATLSLMILLTLIAVGLLSLGAVSIRASTASSDDAIAKANARMSLMIAIGDLQKHAGSDTRITARADILDEANPPFLGAWRSWEGNNHDNTGRPISPGNYAEAKKNRFLGWLNSVSSAGSGTADPPPAIAANGRVTLIGPASLGNTDEAKKLQIHLTPSKVNPTRQPGAFAWWIGGENQKARLPKPYKPDGDTSGRWASRTKSHGIADPKTFNLQSLVDNPQPASLAVSLKEADLIETSSPIPVSKAFFHDLSATSTGLLTNAATGGWKKDISLLTENWDDLSEGKLAFFKLKPGEDVLYDKPSTSNPLPGRAMLYPWATYRNVTSMALDKQGPSSSWLHLRDHATSYRRLLGTSASTPGSINAFSGSIGGTSTREYHDFIHKVRIMPVIARVQWVFSHWAGTPTRLAGQPAPPPGALEPRLLLTPVVTVWNPYNVAITSPPLGFSIPRPIPTNLRYAVKSDGTTKYTAYRPLTGKAGNGLIPGIKPMADVIGFNYDIKTPIALQPGECLIYSPAASSTPVTAGLPLTLEAGFRKGGGHYIPITDAAGKDMALAPGSTLKASARFNTEFYEVGSSGNKGVGIYLDVNVQQKTMLAYRMVYPRNVAERIWKELTDLAESDPLSSLVANPTPYMFTLFGSRMASKTQIAAKGFVQSNPLSNFTSMGARNDGSAFMADYPGSDHPVNSPFDYSFAALTPYDSLLPNASDKTNRGYIITGFNKDSGLSRCVVAEVPTRPLQSLAELTHWDSRYENPIPPFSYNVIGNSDATPLIPANAVVNASVANRKDNLQHDDSYCSNHVLFDDWFVSSISPDPDDFGANGRDMQKVCGDFANGTKPLPNHAYKPVPETLANETDGPGSFYKDQVDQPDSWKTVASRLEVEGMFNVNSTSVTAWRALLGHARNQKVPHQKLSGGSVQVSLSSETDHILSRFSVAGSPESRQSPDGGAFVEANEFTGYRFLDDGMIDALARETVQQIRLRGPFLSLAEFVNRQLAEGDTALAGTIQAALNRLSENASTNPFASVSNPDFTKPSGVVPEHIDPEYSYPKAAVGNSAYGLPGWNRQADVLRPIMPILSARDDTFVIRAYGDSRDSSGKIKARATCEAIVTRSRDYIDPAGNSAEDDTELTEVNQRFGRKYRILSFRWLNPEEI